MAEELKKLTSQVQGVEGDRGIEGLNYEELCIQLDVELPEGYKPPKFKMFDDIGGPRVHLRTYCDKLVGVRKDEKIQMKLFMRSLTGDALSWLKDTCYVTPVPAMTLENPSQWVNPNKTCAYHSGMKGHTTVECQTLKDKIQTLIDNKVIQAKEAAYIIRDNPLPDRRGGGIHSPIEVEVTASVPFEVKVALPAATPAPFEVEVVTPFTATVSTTPPFNSKAIPWDYVAEARQKRKAKVEEFDAAQGMTRTRRVYTPEHLGGSSNDATTRRPIIETGPDDLWRKVQAKEYSVINHLKKIPAQISILSLLQNLEAHKNALIKVLNEPYVPNNITGGEMANMVGQVLEIHKIIFHEDELPPEGLNHNRALHITVQFEDKFIARVLVDGGSSLNIFPLDTLKMLDKEEKTLVRLKNFFLEDEDMDCSAIIEEEEEEGLTIQTAKKGAVLKNWITTPSRARRVPGEVENFENKPKSNLDETEVVNLGDIETVKEARISIHLSPTEKEEYICFLKEYENIFAWSYDDMTGLSTSIVAHKMPTNPTCPPVKQKLRKFKPDMSLKIKEEVTKQIKAKVLRVVEYPTWLANIVPVPKKDGKKAFDKIKKYLSTPPVLVLLELGRPLLLYLSVLDGAFKCVLGQHDETGRKDQAIYYSSKKFTAYEAWYSLLERTCCPLTWIAQKLRHYFCAYTTYLKSRMDPLKYIFQKPMLIGKLSKWQKLLSEFDIVYVTQKAIKGQALADHLAENLVGEAYESLKMYFLDEKVSFVGEDITETYNSWRIFFDGAANFIGVGIGAVLLSETD
ncbi:uncharacterized protein [Nicotiana sylvestris]|uniref:uncharacterized protein n=1 Tax=Nicotiana sylvestris TaxID=4096 RepID=UPI00388CD6EA